MPQRPLFGDLAAPFLAGAACHIAAWVIVALLDPQFLTRRLPSVQEPPSEAPTASLMAREGCASHRHPRCHAASIGPASARDCDNLICGLKLRAETSFPARSPRARTILPPLEGATRKPFVLQLAKSDSRACRKRDSMHASPMERVKTDVCGRSSVFFHSGAFLSFCCYAQSCKKDSADEIIAST